MKERKEERNACKGLQGCECVGAPLAQQNQTLFIGGTQVDEALTMDGAERRHDMYDHIIKKCFSTTPLLQLLQSNRKY